MQHLINFFNIIEAVYECLWEYDTRLAAEYQLLNPNEKKAIAKVVFPGGKLDSEFDIDLYKKAKERHDSSI